MVALKAYLDTLRSSSVSARVLYTVLCSLIAILAAAVKAAAIGAFVKLILFLAAIVLPVLVWFPEIRGAMSWISNHLNGGKHGGEEQSVLRSAADESSTSGGDSDADHDAKDPSVD